MRQKFLIWLALLICTAYTVIGVLGYHRAAGQAWLKTEQVVKTRLYDLQELMRHADSGMQHVEDINNESAIEHTRALAEIIRLSPDVLQNQERLQGLCNDLGAEQIAVTDADGVVIAAVPATNVGYDLGSHEQSREFLRCINSPGTEICQRLRPNGSEGKHLQYAGVCRMDAPGVVQIGFRTRHEEMVRNTAAFSQLASNFNIGKNGSIIAFRQGAVLNSEDFPYPTTSLLALPLNQATDIRLGEELYFAYAVENQGNRIVGLLPMKEVYRDLNSTVLSQLLSNLTLFVVIFAALSYLLQRLVIQGIGQINQSLRNITGGDLSERVNVTYTPEFASLSNGINSMVDALQSYGEQSRLNMERELELARSIQLTALPNTFPAFPNRKEFELYATCSQAKSVGGDFYDFFLTDENHLCFLVADVSGQGVPAALFMMRSMSIIRGLARSGAKPLELVRETNSALCEGNSANMRVNLLYACLEISSGELTFVNAGPPQMLLQKESSAYEMVHMRSGISLGIEPGATFTLGRIQLHPGDRIFAYTDGVIKATNMEHAPFGAARLQAALNSRPAHVTDVTRQVSTALREYTENAEQSQDVTMLAIEYIGKQRSRGSVTVQAGSPSAVAELLNEKLEAVFASPLDIDALQDCAGSILATLPPQTEVQVRLACDEESAELVFSYAAPAVNPLLNLSHLPVDSSSFFSDDAQGCTLTLTKTLA